MNHTLLTQVEFGRLARRAATVLGLLLLALFFGAGSVSSQPLPVPTISITAVQRGQSVSFQTYNYPAGQAFTVRMGKMGTLGLGGEVVGTFNSGNGGSMPGVFNIPPALKDEYQIAIRLDSNQGYYSFNWFYNNTTTAPAPAAPGSGSSSSGYVGIPTFKITAVTQGQTVTIVTDNFPAGQTFYVTMGKMYTQGIGGHDVGILESEAGGTLERTFTIPAALANDGRIAIRAQTAHTNPYYAYNWFWNNSTTTSTTTTTTATTPSTTTSAAIGPVYYGIPTFTVCQVTRDNQVEILTKNYPLNQTFYVTMGPMFTQGIGGEPVGKLESEDKSSGRYVFTIPANLHNSHRISIRAQTNHPYPYYSYNWFYNNTTTMDHCQ